MNVQVVSELEEEKQHELIRTTYSEITIGMDDGNIEKADAGNDIKTKVISRDKLGVVNSRAPILSEEEKNWIAEINKRLSIMSTSDYFEGVDLKKIHWEEKFLKCIKSCCSRMLFGTPEEKDDTLQILKDYSIVLLHDDVLQRRPNLLGYLDFETFAKDVYHSPQIQKYRRYYIMVVVILPIRFVMFVIAMIVSVTDTTQLLLSLLLLIMNAVLSLVSEQEKGTIQSTINASSIALALLLSLTKMFRDNDNINYASPTFVRSAAWVHAFSQKTSDRKKLVDNLLGVESLSQEELAFYNVKTKHIKSYVGDLLMILVWIEMVKNDIAVEHGIQLIDLKDMLVKTYNIIYSAPLSDFMKLHVPDLSKYVSFIRCAQSSDYNSDTLKMVLHVDDELKVNGKTLKFSTLPNNPMIAESIV